MPGSMQAGWLQFKLNPPRVCRLCRYCQDARQESFSNYFLDHLSRVDKRSQMFLRLSWKAFFFEFPQCGTVYYQLPSPVSPAGVLNSVR